MTAGLPRGDLAPDRRDREPDVLVFDYARNYWDRSLSRNKLAGLLSAPGPEVFTIDERPELLTLLMVVWNKAYRRDFVIAGGFHFPTGYYEDTPWTYPTLLVAERIAILDRVCLHYRIRRAASNILNSRTRKHFEIFDQWDRVFGGSTAPEAQRMARVPAAPRARARHTIARARDACRRMRAGSSSGPPTSLPALRSRRTDAAVPSGVRRHWDPPGHENAYRRYRILIFAVKLSVLLSAARGLCVDGRPGSPAGVAASVMRGYYRLQLRLFRSTRTSRCTAAYWDSRGSVQSGRDLRQGPRARARHSWRVLLVNRPESARPPGRRRLGTARFLSPLSG